MSECSYEEDWSVSAGENAEQWDFLILPAWLNLYIIGKKFGIIYWSEGMCTLGSFNSNPRYTANRKACKYKLRDIYNNVVVAICKTDPDWGSNSYLSVKSRMAK